MSVNKQFEATAAWIMVTADTHTYKSNSKKKNQWTTKKYRSTCNSETNNSATMQPTNSSTERISSRKVQKSLMYGHSTFLSIYRFLFHPFQQYPRAQFYLRKANLYARPHLIHFVDIHLFILFFAQCLHYFRYVNARRFSIIW